MKDWNEFFSKIPFTYYRSSLIQNKYIDVINRFAGERSIILELASGSGYTSAIVADLLRKKNCSVFATDIEPKLVEQYEKVHPNLKGKAINAFSIGMPDQSVDMIFHQGFLEHFGDADIIRLLKESGRVAPVIVFDVPNARRWNKVQEFGDERFLTHQKWLSLVKEAGLFVYFHTGRRYTNWWKKFVPKVIYDSDWFGRHFGESSIIVCGSIDLSVKL